MGNRATVRCVLWPSRSGRRSGSSFGCLSLRNQVVKTRSLLMTSFAALCAATTAAAQGSPPTNTRAPLGEIRGRLTDSVAGRAITSGSVAVRRVGDSAFAGGALPKEDGSFRVDGLRPGRYTLRIRAIGFAPVIRNDIAITADHPIVDLGAIALKAVAAKLDATQTVAEREDVVLAPDRTSYSVKNMPAASGGTAIDVLRNIPLVEVDGSNNVSLRGNANVVVQINGRSTPLKGDQLGAFLAQLPAGTREERRGRDESVGEGRSGRHRRHHQHRAQSGSRARAERRPQRGNGVDRHGQRGGNVGKQQGKLTLFASGSIYHDDRSTSGTIVADESRHPGAGVHDDAIWLASQSPISGGGTLRSEYRFTDRNTLSFDGFFYGGRFGGDQSSDYTDLDTARAVIGLFDQASSQSSRNLSQDYDVTFRRLSDKKQPLFSTELEYSNTNANSDIDLSGNVLHADASTPLAIPTEHDRHGRALSVSQLEDRLHRTVRREHQARGGRQGHAAHDDERLRRGLSRFDGRLRVGSAASHGVRLSRGHRRRRTRCCRTRFDKVQTQTGLRLEDAATYFDLDDARPAVRSSLRQRVSERDRLVQLHADCARRGSAIRAASAGRIRISSARSSSTRTRATSSAETRSCAPSTRMRSRSAIRSRGAWGSIQLNPYIRSTDARGAQHSVRGLDRRVGEHVRQRGEHVHGRLGSQRQRPRRPAAARRRRKPLSLLERRVEPRRQSLGARDGLVGAHERDVEVLAEGGRAADGVLSRAVRDRGRLAARVGRDDDRRRATRCGATRATSRCASPIRSSCRSTAIARRMGRWSSTASGSSDRARCISRSRGTSGRRSSCSPSSRIPTRRRRRGRRRAEQGSQEKRRDPRRAGGDEVDDACAAPSVRCLIGLSGADNIAVCAHAVTDPHHEVGGGNHSASCARSRRSWHRSGSASASPALLFRLTGRGISRERRPPSRRRSTPDRRTPTTRHHE